MKRNQGFTFMELILSITILALLATAAYSANIFTQLKKGRDNRRKQEITSFMKVLESYYNDNENYPPVVVGTTDGLDCSGNPESLKPYFQRIPCDPQYPNHTYLYVSDDNTFQQIRLYVQMENPNDSEVLANPCGTPPNYCQITTSQGAKTFNYIITTTNVNLSNPLPPVGAIIP